MRILFIGSRKFDYSQDLAFSGLHKILGPANIRDLPYNYNYHLGYKPYPKNLGYVGANSIFHYYQQKQIWPKNVDVVIVGSTKPDAFETYIQIAKDIPAHVKTVLIDGGDREALGGDLARLSEKPLWQQALEIRPFDFIFKREYLKGRYYEPYIHPLPFSINLQSLKQKPKFYDIQKNKDVTFWAMNSHPLRTKAFAILKGHFDCDQNGTAPCPDLKSYTFQKKRYHEELSKCRIALSLRGAGWDTLRYWEIPALGPLMISTELQIVIPSDFEHEKHMIRCKPDLSDLIELCEFYLKPRQTSLREKITQNAYQHLVVHHTDIARAQYMLKIINSDLSARSLRSSMRTLSPL